MNWVYIHPPRTGGTSIRNQIGWGAIPDPHARSKHAPYWWLARYMDMSKVWTFATVRNPYDRAVSLWQMWGRQSHRDMTFPKWLKDLTEDWPKKLENPPRHYRFEMNDMVFAHFAPQVEWLSGPIDFIVRYESRAPGLSIVSRKIGIEIDPFFRGGSSRPRGCGPSAEHYDDESRETIRRIYARDFRELDYKP